VAASRRNTSQRLTLLMLVLASVTVITLDYRGEARHVVTEVRNAARDALSPVQAAVADVLHPLGDVFSGAIHYSSALRENEVLRQEDGTLRRELLEAGDAASQLDEILRLEHLPFLGNSPTVLAEVISASPSNFELTVEIDRGTSSGVAVGMPVVSGPGLFGQVVAAGADTALVRLLTDPRSSVGVRFGSGGIAVAVGEGAGRALSLEDVTAGMRPRVGEVVYTSGLEGATFPAGIPVGRVSRVHAPAGALTEQVSVEPLAELADPQYVEVVLWLPPA
jgi:rod shape-determining protein MreC